jgi:hypothetical protein
MSGVSAGYKRAACVSGTGLKVHEIHCPDVFVMSRVKSSEMIICSGRIGNWYSTQFLNATVSRVQIKLSITLKLNMLHA